MKTKQLQKNISNEWQNVRIKNVAFVNKNSLGNDTSPDFKFKYIDLSSVNNRQIGFPIQYIKYDEAPSRARRIAQKGDVIMATVRPNLLGYCMVDFDTSEFIYSTGFAVIENKKNLLNNYFLFSYLFSKKFQDDISNMLVGSSYPAINSSDVANIKLPLPPLPEQNRIVSVLETWDKSIQNLNKKIEIKKQIKKGLMQDLLTGKKRLSGFKDKWEFVKLTTICSIQKGKQLNKENMIEDGIYPALNGGIEISGWTNEWNTKENTITISEGGNSCGYINFNKEKFWCGGHCYAINPNKDIDNMFLYQVLKIRQDKIMTLRVGSGLPNIQKKSLDDLKILFPKTKEEQIAISDILTTADKEITKLEKKLSIIKDQKKYLLNNLITGAIRTKEGMKIKT